MKNTFKRHELPRDEFIICIGLPGNQIISRHVCGQRHFLARKKVKNFSKTELDIDEMSSLEICSTCLEGRINMERYRDELINHKNYSNDSSE